MKNREIFDPGEVSCKTPFGAVTAGTEVRLALHPPRRQGWSRARLTVFYEDGEARESVPMSWEGHSLGRDTYAGRFRVAADYIGLVWYSFLLESLDGRKQELGPYQLTVYDRSEPVPAWFGEGVTYQIFPDRFCRSRIPEPLPDRSIHGNWEEEPEYRPDSRGEIRNRDFFGGDLAGITGKLDYLQGLGVDTLYLNPIFEAAENHRYGTADYCRVDPMLGSGDDFSHLCREAHRRGMRVLLDGVFSHTGSESIYFSGPSGAARSEDSPYRSWYRFTSWPDVYDSWWGIRTLPAADKEDPGYREFIFGGKDSVVRRWLRAGADGWRLDVADELPDDFVAGIHRAARAEKPGAVIIGEVWEDGSNKTAYGVRRKHILGGHCDGLINYPLRAAILDYCLKGGGEDFREKMEELREHYPPFAFFGAMNPLGTHDTPRILTLLGTGRDYREKSRDFRAGFRLSPEQRRLGTERLKLASLLLFTFPGSPTVYYGDEAGLEGFEDPFNRRTYPWGREDRELVDWYRALGALRREHPALRRGAICYGPCAGDLLLYLRKGEGETLFCCFNRGEKNIRTRLPCPAVPLLGGGRPEEDELLLPPRTGTVLLAREKKAADDL